MKKIFKGYSTFGFIYLVICKIYTLIFYRKARVIRLPFRIRNQGVFKLSPRFSTGVNNRIDIFPNALLNIGSDVQINDFCHIACADEVVIGNHTLIASKVFISDHDHDFNCLEGAPSSWPLLCSKVLVGNNCWIGENVSILKGVKLGDNCIVGANSVLTRSFPSNSIVAGVPAKLIRTRTVSKIES